MFPVLIDLGTWNLPLLGETPVFLPTYGVMFALSVLVAWFWFSRRARGMGVPDETLFNLVFYTLLASIIGAKALLVIVDWRTYLEDPAALLGTLRSAGVLVGGIIAGAVTFALYARRNGLPVMRLGDAIAAPLVLAQGIGRLGCLLGGCCWGEPVHADHPLAIVFTDPDARAQTGVPLNQPLIATQLVELVVDLLIAVALTWGWRRQPRVAGTVFWSYVAMYSTARMVIEFWRGDHHRGLYFGEQISTSQLFALIGLVMALAMLWRGQRQARQAVSA